MTNINATSAATLTPGETTFRAREAAAAAEFRVAPLAATTPLDVLEKTFAPKKFLANKIEHATRLYDVVREYSRRYSPAVVTARYRYILDTLEGAERQGWKPSTEVVFTKAECLKMLGNREGARAMIQAVIDNPAKFSDYADHGQYQLGAGAFVSQKYGPLNSTNTARFATEAALQTMASMFPTLEVGQPPPAIEKKDIDGKRFSLEQYKGKVVLLDFWWSTCAPSRVVEPAIRHAYEQYKDKGLVVLGVSSDKNGPALRKYLADNKIEWPQYADDKGWMNDIQAQFKIGYIPSFVLIDAEGKISFIHASDGRELIEDMGAKLKSNLATMLGTP